MWVRFPPELQIIATLAQLVEHRPEKAAASVRCRQVARLEKRDGLRATRKGGNARDETIAAALAL